MATEYCDHGAYGAAVFTGSISTTTLTVSAVASGVIGVGSQITGSGVADFTYVTALGTGTGGTGTYTISVSQTVSSTTMNGAFANPQNTPVWGIPQEGDGTTKTKATASATTSWDLSAATAAAGATISIMGAVLTCVASGATNNQFNAGAGTTLIDNIVTAINRAGNTVTVAAQASGWSTPKVQDAVFARRTGNNLEVMTRAGSATYNGLTAMTQSGFTGTVPANPTWSGGSGGCWGYLINPLYAMFPSGVSRHGYGVLCGTAPIAGAFNPGDVVIIRSGKRIYAHCLSNGDGIRMRAIGSTNSPVDFVVDTSSEWSDGVDPVLWFDTITNGNNFVWGFQPPNAAAHFRFLGSKYPSGTRNVRITGRAGYQGAGGCVLNAGGFSYFRSIFIEQILNQGAVVVQTSSDQAGAQSTVFEDIYVKGINQFGTNTATFIGGGGTYPVETTFINSVFEFAGNTAHGGAVSTSGYGGSYLLIQGCKFIGFVTGSQLVSQGSVTTTIANNAGFEIQFMNCDFGGITRRGGYLTGISGRTGDTSPFISIATNLPSADFSIDTPRGYSCWNSAQIFPKLNATLLDGVTKWSILYRPTRTAGAAKYMRGAYLPTFNKENTLGTGIRTVTVNFLLDTTLTGWTQADIYLMLSYINSAGEPKCISSVANANAPLESSDANWDSLQYNDGGVLTYNRHKLTMTTQESVLAGSMMSVDVVICRAVNDSTQGLFFCPELVIT